MGRVRKPRPIAFAQCKRTTRRACRSHCSTSARIVAFIYGPSPALDEGLLSARRGEAAATEVRTSSRHLEVARVGHPRTRQPSQLDGYSQRPIIEVDLLMPSHSSTSHSTTSRRLHREPRLVQQMDLATGAPTTSEHRALDGTLACQKADDRACTRVTHFAWRSTARVQQPFFRSRGGLGKSRSRSRLGPHNLMTLARTLNEQLSTLQQ